MSQLTVEVIQEGGLQLVEVLHAGPRGAAGETGPTGVVAAAAPITYNSGTKTVGITAATPSDAGSMSGEDKAKLDSIVVDRAKLTVVSVRNNSGTSIPKGAAVYVTGSTGVTVTVALADASGEATAANTLGVAYETIGNNASGLVVTEGELGGVDTSALTEGGLLWLSETTGGVTTTRPTQPAHGVVMGWCIKQGHGSSGIIYVRVDNGQELYELHDVLISGATTGQVLRRAADGLWKNAVLAAGDISGLASVATSGAYGDLSGRPSLASVATSGAYGDLSGLPSLGGAAALNVGTTAGTVAAGNDARLSTNITYDAATREVRSSTGDDAVLPLVTTSAAGLASAGDKQKINIAVVSDATGITGADAVTNIVSLTQAEYNAIASPSATTLYVITD